jgi:hypothetical protein
MRFLKQVSCATTLFTCETFIMQTGQLRIGFPPSWMACFAKSVVGGWLSVVGGRLAHHSGMRVFSFQLGPCCAQAKCMPYFSDVRMCRLRLHQRHLVLSTVQGASSGIAPAAAAGRALTASSSSSSRPTGATSGNAVRLH